MRIPGLASLFLAAAVCLPVQAQNVELAGVRYAPTVTLAGAPLLLNGAGIRYKLVFKVYTAGLYLSAKAATPEQVLAASGPRRLHIVMLRRIDASELGRLFTRGMEDNAQPGEMSRLIPGILKMGDIFSARKQLAAGESFSVDYVPGTGTTILVNGQPMAEPIKEPEFFNALMRIWLGTSPADALLKDALLGQTAPPRSPYQ
jgi:hypothetical protein